jgi:hypothetical protein
MGGGVGGSPPKTVKPSFRPLYGSSGGSPSTDETQDGLGGDPSRLHPTLLGKTLGVKIWTPARQDMALSQDAIGVPFPGRICLCSFLFLALGTRFQEVLHTSGVSHPTFDIAQGNLCI